MSGAHDIVSPHSVLTSGAARLGMPWFVTVLMLLVLIFIALRLPAALLAPGAQDEEWYGVPGLTIAQEGIPRVPYSRADSADSVFFGAEEMLFAQPPLSFYAQAPFFLCLPATYGTARLASFAAGCLSIVLTFLIGQVMFRDARIALLAAGVYSFSRLCFFPAMVARPDMICGMLGLLAVYCMARWQESPRSGWLLAAGLSLGLAGLSHPFAIVFAIQLTVWIGLKQGSLAARLKRLSGFFLAVAIAFSLWLPLIAMRPDLFAAQFIGNILRPAGPGLLSRFVFPMESFANQIPQLWERAHPIQFSLLSAAFVATGIVYIRRKDRGLGLCWLLATSSIYLLVVCLGVHPIQGFWCYTAALGWLCFAYLFFSTCDYLFSRDTTRRVAIGCGLAIILVAMLPGSGMRAVVTYAARWNDPVYSSPRFIRSVLADLPPEATLTVGPEFALDSYAQGRQVILACRHPLYFDSTRYPTDYYIFGRRDFAENMPQAYQCEWIKSYGHRDNVFANYAEVYRRSE